MRKVTVVSTKANKKATIETSAAVWGDLKDVLTVKGVLNENGMKALIKETRVTLESREAQLPTGDFVLYLIPTKNESGILTKEDLEDAVADLKERLMDEVNAWMEEYVDAEDDDFEAARKEVGC